MNFGQDVDLVLEVVEESGCKTLSLDDLDSKLLIAIGLEMALLDLSELSPPECLSLDYVVRYSLHFTINSKVINV
jgi:hypothetical protein